MEEYLVFIKRFGMKSNGKLVYQFYFSTEPEVVWGDYWNVCPCSIVPDLKPDMNSVSSVYEAEFDEELNLAINNSCFSMQDCIDHIISLGFFDIENTEYKIDSKIVRFDFGDSMDKVVGNLDGIGSVYFKTDFNPSSEDDDLIDNLIDKLDKNEQ